MICGYKGSGKDTLYQDVNEHRVHVRWNIYYSPHNNNTRRDVFQETYKRVSFADRLKLHTIHKYNLDDDIQKDTYIDRLGCTFRQLVITEGRSSTRANPYIWTERALYEYNNTSNIPIFITDWRFDHEYHYLMNTWIPAYRSHARVATARVVRLNVPIPEPNDKSEHFLDHWSTDYLIISKKDDLHDVVKFFPQYCDYIRCY